jgi:hypothetical protein
MKPQPVRGVPDDVGDGLPLWPQLEELLEPGPVRPGCAPAALLDLLDLDDLAE